MWQKNPAVNFPPSVSESLSSREGSVMSNSPSDLLSPGLVEGTIVLIASCIYFSFMQTPYLLNLHETVKIGVQQKSVHAKKQVFLVDPFATKVDLVATPAKKKMVLSIQFWI